MPLAGLTWQQQESWSLPESSAVALCAGLHCLLQIAVGLGWGQVGLLRGLLHPALVQWRLWHASETVHAERDLVVGHCLAVRTLSYLLPGSNKHGLSAHMSVQRVWVSMAVRTSTAGFDERLQKVMHASQSHRHTSLVWFEMQHQLRL